MDNTIYQLDRGLSLMYDYRWRPVTPMRDANTCRDCRSGLDHAPIAWWCSYCNTACFDTDSRLYKDWERMKAMITNLKEANKKLVAENQKLREEREDAKSTDTREV